VCGPYDQYPLLPERLYNPPLASVHDYVGMLDALGIERGVLVQPSVYGVDNSAMLDALKLFPQRLRGVAVVKQDVSVEDLQQMHKVGVRGVRINIVDLKNNKGKLPLDDIRRLAEKIKPLSWHIEFLMHTNEFPNLEQDLGDLPVDLVFGHLGYVPTKEGLHTQGFESLIRLVKAKKAWIKLTAPYRLTLNHLPYPDVNAFADRLVSEVSDRLIWGSDWPHVFIKTPMPNDGELFNIFTDWVRSPELVKKILVDNPKTLYDF
jgi:predicted TIM-barrel fold metal-dependent hydrolase